MDSGAQCVMTALVLLKQLLLVDNWDITLTPAIIPTCCECISQYRYFYIQVLKLSIVFSVICAIL